MIASRYSHDPGECCTVEVGLVEVVLHEGPLIGNCLLFLIIIVIIIIIMINRRAPFMQSSPKRGRIQK